MNSTHPVQLGIVFLFAAYASSAHAQSGIDPERLAGIRDRLSQINNVLASFPEAQQKTLSAGAQNLITIAQGWNRVDEDLGKSPEIRARARSMSRSLSSSAEDAAPDFSFTRISNPSADFIFSVLGGFTQSETSTAWCGNNVVTGFNDSGSLYESLLFGPGGVSFSGASVSSSPRGPFRDVGFINPGTNPANFLAGDPVVTCTTTPRSSGFGAINTFYYSQIFSTSSAAGPVTAIAVSRSTDGGAAWEDPIPAVQKSGLTHFLDKPWSATDPSNPANLFVTYTDFDSSGAVCRTSTGLPISRTAIELVNSGDGGATWTSPLIIAEFCAGAPDFASVQGSQVLADSLGNVSVTWESFVGITGTTRALWTRRSTDHSASFGSAVKIDNVTPTGDGYALQGNFRNNEFPLMAVDRKSGALYVTWNDGRNFALPDLATPDGVYHYADVLVSRSTDGGATWSTATRVNADPLTHFYRGQSRGTDHYLPGIAVDPTGAVGVCWYDRRADPANFANGRFCSISNDGGSTWSSNFFINGFWQPWHAMDASINPYYLGDYDSVASDFTQMNTGFVGAFSFVNTLALVPNQDVGVLSFP